MINKNNNILIISQSATKIIIKAIKNIIFIRIFTILNNSSKTKMIISINTSEFFLEEFLAIILYFI